MKIALNVEETGMDDLSIKGMLGIITGGSSGIGLAMVHRFASEGAFVFALSRRGEAADGFKHDLVTHIKCDITDDQALKETIESIGSEYGIDYLINNAGRSIKKRAEDMSSDDFHAVISLNLEAMFRCCTLCFPYLRSSKYTGRIINISSMAAHLGFEQVVPYCASKAGVLGLTRALAMEWVKDNITVNSIAPGWFPSELNQKIIDEKRMRRIMHRIPMKCFGDTEDLAAMAQFLLSQRARYITGRDFPVDGGALSFGL